MSIVGKNHISHCYRTLAATKINNEFEKMRL
jgi:hypothetical protein